MDSSSLALKSTKFSRIEQNITEIEQCIVQIRKKHSRILSSPFHDEVDYTELDRLMAKVQSLSAQTWTLLKASKQNRLKSGPVRSSTIRMENVQISSLYQKFIDVLTEYSAAQTEFRDKKKKLLRKQLEITGQNVNDDELEKMIEENKAVFTQDYIVQVERTREDLTDVKQRCSQILKIENSLRELDDMLLSLSILVNSQGEVIDSIEQHVLQASEDVKDGNKQMEKAAKKKKSIRKTKIGIIICLLVIIGVLIIIAVVLS